MARSSRSSSSSSSSTSSSRSSRFTASTESTWSTTHRRVPVRSSLSVRIFAYAAGASPTSDIIRVLTKDTPDYSSQGGPFQQPERQCFWVEDPYRNSSRSRTPSPRHGMPIHPAARGAPRPGAQPDIRPPPARGMPGAGPSVPGMPGAPMMGTGAGRPRPPMNYPPMPGRNDGAGGPRPGGPPPGPPGFRPPPSGIGPPAR